MSTRSDQAQTGERLAALKVLPSDLAKEMLLIPEKSAIELLDEYSSVEEDLTLVEHKLMVALGLVSVPDDEAQEKDYVLHATYVLAAATVRADGRIEPEEISIAEEVGARLMEGFDTVDFREACTKVDDAPGIQALSELLKGGLNPTDHLS